MIKPNFSVWDIIWIVGLFCPNNQKFIYRRTTAHTFVSTSSTLKQFLQPLWSHIIPGFLFLKRLVWLSCLWTNCKSAGQQNWLNRWKIHMSTTIQQSGARLQQNVRMFQLVSNFYKMIPFLSLQWKCFVECPEPLKLKLNTLIFLTKEKTKRWSLKVEKNICTLCFYHLTLGSKWLFAWLLSLEFLWDHEITAESRGTSLRIRNWDSPALAKHTDPFPVALWIFPH